MTNAALIVAAGRGSRMGTQTPKQYLKLGDHMVLHHTVMSFLACDRIDAVCVVIHPDDRELYGKATAEIMDSRMLSPVTGGASRSASVQLGLKALEDPTHVLIHDAARPFCSADLITRVLDALSEADGAFAALPVVDALWKIDGIEALSPIPRTGLWRAQTPQAFRYEEILRAYYAVNDANAADDVEIARKAGLHVNVVQGTEENFKITMSSDLARAKRHLQMPRLQERGT